MEQHNSVASRIAAHCKKKGWTTFEEPHIRHQDGTLFKPDIVAFTSPDTAVVCDAQVSWETSEPISANGVCATTKNLGRPLFKSGPMSTYTFSPVFEAPEEFGRRAKRRPQKLYNCDLLRLSP